MCGKEFKIYYQLIEMYSDSRVGWWVGRSSSQEYQKAYSEIARYIPKGQRGVFVDVACGMGEVLRRVYRRGKFDLIVGTDDSENMLQRARKNLSSYGVSATAERAGTNIRNRKGVVLLEDNLLESQLPDGFADFATFTFPELGADYRSKPEDRKLVESVLGDDFIEPENYEDCVVSFKSEQQLCRILKPGGRLLIVVYGMSYGAESGYDNRVLRDKRTLSAALGLTLVGLEFLESKEIWSDTTDAKDGSGALETGQKGYRIFEFRKR